MTDIKEKIAKILKKAGVKFLGRVPRGTSSIFPNETEYIHDFNDF